MVVKQEYEGWISNREGCLRVKDGVLVWLRSVVVFAQEEWIENLAGFIMIMMLIFS